MSALGQKRTSRISLDYLVSSRQQRWRHCEAEHSGGLSIDDQLKLARLHHRHVLGLRAFMTPVCKLRRGFLASGTLLSTRHC